MFTFLESNVLANNSLVNISIGGGGTSNPFNQSAEDIMTSGKYRGNLNDYTGGSTDSGEYQLKDMIRYQIIPTIKRFLIPISIMLMTWTGLNLFLTRGDEDAFKKAIRQGLSIMTGFFIFALATNILDWGLFGHEGEIFRGDGMPKEFAKWSVVELMGLFKFFSSFVVIIAVMFIIFNAFQLMVHGEDESEISNVKKRLIYTVVGIVILISANWIVMFMVDSDGKIMMPDVASNIQLGMKWTNYILGFVGIVAIVSLVWGGFRLITNFGNDQVMEEAKRIIISSVIGIVVAFSAWTIIYFFLSPT